jgi:hypothetical protein
MDFNGATPSGREAAVPLDPSKAIHVISDGSLTGAQRELEGRRFVWIHTIERAIAMLRVSIRAQAWFLEIGLRYAKSTWVSALLTHRRRRCARTG